MFKGIFAGTVNVDLIVPLKWEDREIKTVELDFSKVNGKLINDCQRETFDNFQGNSSVVLVPSQVPEYCARMAAAISGLSFRALEKMNFLDYENVTGVVSIFLKKKNPKKFWEEYVKSMAESDDDEEDAGELFTKPDLEPGKNTKT